MRCTQGFGGDNCGKEPLARPRRRWEENIKIVIQVLCWGGTDWIDLFQNRGSWCALVNAVMNIRVP